jgi:hypothetical protein
VIFLIDMNKIKYSAEIKKEIVALQKLQQILRVKNPSHDFLEPLIGNVIGSLTDLLCYLEGKNPYYISFDESFFHNRQVAMHRTFFSDMHVTTEDGLRKIIREKNLEVPVNKIKNVQSIVNNIKTKVADSHIITNELKKILRLASNYPSFNDHLDAVFHSIRGIDKRYKHSCRAYFDAVNIIRNKVSHSDMTLSKEEKEKLVVAKFKNAISNNGRLQMTFKGYESLISDLIKFFDTICAKL